MTLSATFLALVDIKQLRNAHRDSPGKTGVDMVLGAIGLVVVLLVLWAIFIRKREDQTARRYREHFSGDEETAVNSGGSSSENEAGRRFRRKRRRKREHRQRNPTLAETGGLPPLRDELPSDEPP